MDEIDQKIQTNQAIPLSECLFCSETFSTLEQNRQHMTEIHSFFIPDIEYLTDLEGLITYLGEKIGIGNICLYCNGRGRSFATLKAVRDHMRDLSHCKLAWEDNEDEYEDFYDYAPSHAEGEFKGPIEVTDSGEIIFPDGRIIGHRSLKTYYKQRYAPEDSRDSVVINRELNQLKLLGWNDDKVSTLERTRVDVSKLEQHRLDLGVRHNWLHRFRKENVTTRNSGR